MMSEEKLREYFLEMLKTEYPDEEFEKDRLVMTHMGFMKPGLELKKLLVDFYSDNIAGFYDTDTKQLFLIAEPPPKPGAKKKSLWDRVFGSGGGFDWSGNRSVISHELAHALADQQFDLHSLHGSVEDDADMTLALSALIEGEAMLVMILDASEPNSRERARTLQGMEAAGAVMNLLVSATAGLAGGKSFRQAPLILRESMLFPYTKGQAFCARLTATGNWRGIDRAFKRPPVSTEQILHPEKWVGDTIDNPVALTFKKDVPLDSSRWELVDQNVSGEFATEVLLRQYVGRARSVPASTGWDGDTYRLYRDTKTEGDRTMLVWTSTWDSETDASEFASALWRMSQNRGAREKGAFQVAGVKVEDGQLFTRDVGVSAIWREGTHVWLIDQAKAADLDQLVSWSREIKREPKRFIFKKTESKVSFPKD
jgi:hypothetical protein